MLRAAVIWRVPALRMSDVRCPGPAELRRIGQLGPLCAQISARDRGKFASGIGPDGMAVAPGLGHAHRAPPCPTDRLASQPAAGHPSKRPFHLIRCRDHRTDFEQTILCFPVNKSTLFCRKWTGRQAPSAILAPSA